MFAFWNLSQLGLFCSLFELERWYVHQRYLSMYTECWQSYVDCWHLIQHCNLKPPLYKYLEKVARQIDRHPEPIKASGRSLLTISMGYKFIAKKIYTNQLFSSLWSICVRCFVFIVQCWSLRQKVATLLLMQRSNEFIIDYFCNSISFDAFSSKEPGKIFWVLLK